MDQEPEKPPFAEVAQRAVQASTERGPTDVTTSSSSSSADQRRKLPPTVDAAEWGLVDPTLRNAITEWAVAKPPRPLFLFGHAGSGKTSAAAAVFSRWKGSAAWYASSKVVQTLIDARRLGFVVVYSAEHGQSYEIYPQQILRRCHESTLVVFDDVGTTLPTEAGYEALLELINERAGKHTIFTSNLSPQEIRQSMDDRILSRMCAGHVIEVTGKDRRLANAKVRKA